MVYDFLHVTCDNQIPDRQAHIGTHEKIFEKPKTALRTFIFIEQPKSDVNSLQNVCIRNNIISIAVWLILIDPLSFF